MKSRYLELVRLMAKDQMLATEYTSAILHRRWNAGIKRFRWKAGLYRRTLRIGELTFMIKDDARHLEEYNSRVKQQVPEQV